MKNSRKYTMISVNEKVYSKIKELQEKLNSDPEDPRSYSMGDVIWDLYRVANEALRND